VTEAEPGSQGPVDFVLIAFAGDRLSEVAAAELLALVDNGIVRIYDVQVIGKAEDGSVYRQTVARTAPELAGFVQLAWSATGLLDERDVDEAADAMEPGTRAVLVVYENVWSIPFITATWTSGGRVIASARLAAEDVTRATGPPVP